MEPFKRLTAVAAPFDTPDIDTDMIIPQRFLRKPLTVGYRNFLFFNDRFDAAGKEKPDFILHTEPYKKAGIFVTGPNFGCGSTREGAVYAVVDFGVRAVIAPSFGAFYMSNSYQNGLLPVVLPEADVRKLRVAAAFQMCLRGSPCLYQGDELGLPEAQVAYEDLQDPYGITMWPEFKGRDGCRTPMPWVSSAPDLGFAPAGKASAKPWLPVAESHRALAADVQAEAPDSLLNFYRHLLHWRKTQSALLRGDMKLLAVDAQVFAFVRSLDKQRLLCVFNFSDQAASYALPADCRVAQLLSDSGLSGATLAPDCVNLAPWGGLFAQLV